MAYDSLLYLVDRSVSTSLWVGDSTQLTSNFATKKILLPGVPLRGLNLNVILGAAESVAQADITLLEAVSTGAAFTLFRRFPLFTTKGNYNFRFHLDKGYFAMMASITVKSVSSGPGFGPSDIRVGMDEGAQGNAY